MYSVHHSADLGTGRGSLVGRGTLHPLTRAILALAALAALTAAASRAGAQGTPSAAAGALELRPYVGAYVPTGEQRDALEDALLVGAQGSYRVSPRLAVTATVGWSPGEDRLSVGEGELDVFQYDVGAELRVPAWRSGRSWVLSPFAGLGIGGRTYDYEEFEVDSQSSVAGYGAVGADLALPAWGLRLEARDYVSRFEPTTGDGDAETRNDVTIAAGLTLRF